MMLWRRAAAGLAAMILAGCGTTVAGAPGPVTAVGDAPVTAQRLDPSVPRVANPRDARNVAACDLLTQAQLASFDADPLTATASEQNTGLRCEWRTRDKLGSLEAVVAAELGTNGFLAGLAQLYSQRDTFDVFEPGELDGFPIVHADRVVNAGDCTIYVGAADDQLFYTAAGYASGETKRCDIARRMASAVLSNLPPLK